MTNTVATELILAGVAAGVGIVIGLVQRLSKRRRAQFKAPMSRLNPSGRTARSRSNSQPDPLGRAIGADEAEAERRHQHAAFLGHKSFLVEAFRPDTTAIQVRDTVVYAFSDAPGRQVTVTISSDRHDPDRHIVPLRHSLAEALLGRHKGDEVQVSAGGSMRSATVIEVIKPSQPG